MLNKKLGLLVVLLSAILTGCATPPHTLNYSPSSTMSVEGKLNVGDFKYVPGDENPKVKPNQIRNTALGNIYFEKNIDVYFETAVLTEARFVGIDVGKSTNVVSGEIIEFLIDDLGYSIDWTLTVAYKVSNENGSDVCYEATQTLEKNSAKFGNVFGTLNEVMKLNIEKVFQDEAFVACINE